MSHPSAGEEYWIERVRRGDGEALEYLFRRYLPRVYGFAYAMLRSREEAEEVVTDTFLRVFRFASDLRGQGTFEAWLMRVARNLCLDRLRQPRLLTLPLETLPEEGAEWSALLASRDEVERTALRCLVEQALESLSEDHRVALILRDLQGFSAREAAAAIGKSEPAFRSLHQRARRAFRDALRSLDER